MLWFFLALATALAVAVRDVSVKLLAEQSALEIAALELFWSLPLFAMGLLLVPVPLLDGTFWLAFLLSLPLNGVAYLLYLHALKRSPLSLTLPFLAFTPVFMILTGFVVLREGVTLWGGLGIALIGIGSYLLHADRIGHGLLRPLSAIVHEQGSRFMLLAALLFAFAAVVGKQAILHSSPLFFSYLFFLVFNGIILAVLLLGNKSSWHHLRTYRSQGLWLGVLLLLHISCHGLAIAISTAVYMVAVKRSSILFGVFLGWFLLQEQQMINRGLGTACMFLGVVLISLLG